MFFIPYGHIEIKSKLTADEIERRLKERLDPHSNISGMFRGEHKYFQGNMENGELRISRIIHYRNSFRPVITGKLKSEIDHIVIDLTFRLDFVVLALLIFILFGSLNNFILSMFSVLFQSSSNQSVEFLQYLPEGYWLKFILSSIGGILFLYLFIMIPFNIEARKALKYLDKLFENQLDRQNNHS
ncbi:MAG: hypothetical protein OT477_09765 [Chloroflexi bacterium]|nr:hypothetical protein [Chloroflexota bacterium]